MSDRFRSLLAICALGMTCNAAPALASGVITTQLAPRNFGSFAECRTELARLRAASEADAMPWQRRDDGSLFRRVFQGEIAEPGADRATYRGEVGSIARFADREFVRSQYSFAREERTCEGRTMTGFSQQGFSLPSFEPLPPGGRVQPPAGE